MSFRKSSRNSSKKFPNYRKYTKKNTLNARRESKTEPVDIGYRHTSFIKDTNPDIKYFLKISSIDFTCDVLQYLIKYQKFDIKLKEVINGNPLYGICVNDNRLPVLQDEVLTKLKLNNLIVNINIHNLFDAVQVLILDEPKFKPKDFLIVLKPQDHYEKYRELMREYYFNLYNNPGTTIHLWDNYPERIVFPISCASDYGIEPSKHLDSNPRKDDILKKDYIVAFAASNKQKSKDKTKHTYDLVKKYYEKPVDMPFDGIPTPYFDVNGEIHPTVIMDEMPYPGIANKKFLIIGTEKVAFRQLANCEFTKLAEYGSILEEQSARYEEWVKEYTFQELGNPAGLSASDMTFGDYIMNKKKIADVDIKYIRDMGLLSPDELIKLKDFAKDKTNKMCKDKFNKPNISLQYIWIILEITFESADTTSEIIKIEPMAYTIREINENHTEVLKRIQRLSWTEMLYRNNVIPRDSNENLDYKQVFTEIEITFEFKLISYYLHPLNYKTNYFYKENKVIPLEELIINSALKCDGLYPGMENYSGLPFYAVVPLELTNYSYILNSGTYFNDFECNPNMSGGGNIVPLPSQSINPTHPNMGKYTSAAAAGNRSRNARDVRDADNADKILDKTVIIDSQYPREGEVRSPYADIKYLERLFKNPDMKVYSNLITHNGLLITILYDSHPEKKKFYYLVLEIDIIDIVDFYKNFVRELKKYNINQSTFRKIYGAPNDKPILNIRLVKEFTPKDKVFSTLGNECIYKVISGLHDFFIQDTIKLDKRNGEVPVEIPNFYNNILFSLLNIVKSSYDFFNSMALSDRVNDPIGYYKSKDGTYKLFTDDIDKDDIDYSFEKRPQLDSKGILEQPNKNNMCISVGQKYIVVLNKFYGDVLKTDILTKTQLNKHFKYTAWIIPRDYILECLKIINNQQTLSNTNKNTRKTYKIPKVLKEKMLFQITSIKNNNEVVELRQHISQLLKYVNNEILDDKTLCKSYKPKLNINILSDIADSNFHIHFIQEIIQDYTMKFINYKYELLHKNQSIYDIYNFISISLEKIFSKNKIKNGSIYNNFLGNPYIPITKLSGILSINI